MDFKLTTPEAVLKDREERRGMNGFLEILVFIAVFFVVTVAESILMVPMLWSLMAADAGFQEAAVSGNAAWLMEAADRLMSGDSATL